MFVETYPQYVDGLILSGTGMYSLWKGLPTVKVLQLITKIYGAEKRVEWVNQLVSNSFNKKYVHYVHKVIGFLVIQLK